MRYIFAALPLVLAATSASAQLLEDRTNGETRTCVYVGTEQQGDQVVPRTLTLTLGQACPAVAPFHDPNLPIPSNAALVGDTTDTAGRHCTYTQGAVNYERIVPIDQPCGMTPALLDRLIVERRPGEP